VHVRYFQETGISQPFKTQDYLFVLSTWPTSIGCPEFATRRFVIKVRQSTVVKQFFINPLLFGVTSL
jgi:hypothetical protein